jgi:hypothetical protein
MAALAPNAYLEAFPVDRSWSLTLWAAVRSGRFLRPASQNRKAHVWKWPLTGLAEKTQSGGLGRGGGPRFGQDHSDRVRSMRPAGR